MHDQRGAAAVVRPGRIDQPGDFQIDVLFRDHDRRPFVLFARAGPADVDEHACLLLPPALRAAVSLIGFSSRLRKQQVFPGLGRQRHAQAVDAGVLVHHARHRQVGQAHANALEDRQAGALRPRLP
ncbi:hypothetical protein G6F40_017687 [Rhizopus arrhizus]|nr:hypothetical protein G6F40_017687 [Rhizopus arrhizus]